MAIASLYSRVCYQPQSGEKRIVSPSKAPACRKAVALPGTHVPQIHIATKSSFPAYPNPQVSDPKAECEGVKEGLMLQNTSPEKFSAHGSVFIHKQVHGRQKAATKASV